MLADAEEATDADHHGLDVAALVHQQIVDRTEALVALVIDAEADEFRRTQLPWNEVSDAVAAGAGFALSVVAVGVCANATVASKAEPTTAAVLNFDNM